MLHFAYFLLLLLVLAGRNLYLLCGSKYAGTKNESAGRWQKTHGVPLFRSDLLSADSCVFWFSISVARATIATHQWLIKMSWSNLECGYLLSIKQLLEQRLFAFVICSNFKYLIHCQWLNKKSRYLFFNFSWLAQFIVLKILQKIPESYYVVLLVVRSKNIIYNSYGEVEVGLQKYPYTPQSATIIYI